MKELEELVALFETMTATASSETQATVFQWCLDAAREKIAEIEAKQKIDLQKEVADMMSHFPRGERDT